MATPQETFHQTRLKIVAESLKANFFEATAHETLKDAEDHLLDAIIPSGPYVSVGFGGSATVAGSRLLPRLGAANDLKIVDRNDPGLTADERLEASRRTLLVDLFVASSNAVTLDGQLVNVDKFGNRVAAMAFGPRKVALLIGRNKIVEDASAGLRRSKDAAASMNALRLGQDTPCARTAKCHDCRGQNRLCGVVSITQKSFPPGRIHVLLINEDLGF
ncbi:MAG: lactate utilization protein [Deltaproteobacteria bacterium]|jgi:hypothetical protein|nr:lactate utilization protein [Deltaproteobacteria bacterium]